MLSSTLYDGTGLCLLYKRLETGQFTNLWDPDQPQRLSTMELRLLIEGAELKGKLPLTPPEFEILKKCELMDIA
ncbi:IS66 family insertion sequence element accessory protein TnpB [Sulfidibacter corallicola]|uniref:IS66 family insertion sequence element accessory protein TnpB n=1 Tax=Sulfidibacter corallicola TaxID=2818388 RepID=A0A8A4TKT8_SULCO|nr:IS66 family insertion sequence element accessory protein TnpB [Sulfidibacter corallicola]